MSDPAPTRQSVVEANIAKVLTDYNEDAVLRMIYTCIKDISVSLAMLVDNDTSSSSGT